MAVFKIEIQDHNGNVYYPKTSADIVIYETSSNAGKTLKQRLDDIAAKMK